MEINEKEENNLMERERERDRERGMASEDEFQKWSGSVRRQQVDPQPQTQKTARGQTAGFLAWFRRGYGWGNALSSGIADVLSAVGKRLASALRANGNEKGEAIAAAPVAAPKDLSREFDRFGVSLLRRTKAQAVVAESEENRREEASIIEWVMDAKDAHSAATRLSYVQNLRSDQGGDRIREALRQSVTVPKILGWTEGQHDAVRVFDALDKVGLSTEVCKTVRFLSVSLQPQDRDLARQALQSAERSARYTQSILDTLAANSDPGKVKKPEVLISMLTQAYNASTACESANDAVVEKLKSWPAETWSKIAETTALAPKEGVKNLGRLWGLVRECGAQESFLRVEPGKRSAAATAFMLAQGCGMAIVGVDPTLGKLVSREILGGGANEKRSEGVEAAKIGAAKTKAKERAKEKAIKEEAKPKVTIVGDEAEGIGV